VCSRCPGCPRRRVRSAWPRGGHRGRGHHAKQLVHLLSTPLDDLPGGSRAVLQLEHYAVLMAHLDFQTRPPDGRAHRHGRGQAWDQNQHHPPGEQRQSQV